MEHPGNILLKLTGEVKETSLCPVVIDTTKDDLSPEEIRQLIHELLVRQIGD